MPPASLDILDDVYAVYEAFSKDLAVACRRGCCVCCTQDVAITTLEGRRILKRLAVWENPGRDRLAAAIQSSPAASHRPVTTNMFARLCLHGQDPPEDNRDELRQKRCLFLSATDCLIYSDRPFACRSFFSTQPCRLDGSAVVDPFWLTVNSLFLQFIEALDEGGFFGPMNQVLSFLIAHGGTELDKLVTPYPTPNDRKATLAQNAAIPALMVPPEHEQRTQRVLNRLKEIARKHERVSRPGR